MSEVKIKLQMNKLSKVLIVRKTNEDGSYIYITKEDDIHTYIDLPELSIDSIHLLIEYSITTNIENNFLESNKFIVPITKIVSFTKHITNDIAKIDIEIKYPIKYIMFAFTNLEAIANNIHSEYTIEGNSDPLLYVSLQQNDTMKLEKVNKDFFSKIQPYHYNNKREIAMKGIYLYSLSKDLSAKNEINGTLDGTKLKFQYTFYLRTINKYGKKIKINYNLEMRFFVIDLLHYENGCAELSY